MVRVSTHNVCFMVRASTHIAQRAAYIVGPARYERDQAELGVFRGRWPASLFRCVGEEAFLVNLGSHDEVYQAVRRTAMETYVSMR